MDIHKIMCLSNISTLLTLCLILLFNRLILLQLTLVISTSLISYTAYLEVKIWSLLKHENLITGNKILWKRGRSNFSSFPQYFQHISNFKSPITYTYVKCDCSIYFFLNSANLICRSTEISKYFRESLGIRDNESRLYIWICVKLLGKWQIV